MKPTQTLFALRYRRLKLTTKDVKKGFYKGTGSGSMGTHTKFGGYQIDYNKVRTYVVPKDLDKFQLKPFVTNKMKPTYGGGGYGSQGGPGSAKLYLERWKLENGLD